MEISCPDGGGGGRKNVFPSSHEEIHPTGILSVVANLTPWSDHNQSPRNMYQCQVCIHAGSSSPFISVSSAVLTTFILCAT